MATTPIKTIQASEAKTHFLRILDDVERGETVTITRHGRTVATICPAGQTYQERAKKAFEAMREIRSRTKPVSLEEIRQFRDEGRM
jgi:prevent-host-death family protein